MDFGQDMLKHMDKGSKVINRLSGGQYVYTECHDSKGRQSRLQEINYDTADGSEYMINSNKMQQT